MLNTRSHFGLKHVGLELFCSAVSCLSVFGAMHSSTARATDWARFRGPEGSGVADKLNLPDDFSLENVSWKIPSAAGTSSLVISEGKIFATSFDGDQRALRCLDANSGKELWVQTTQSLRKRRRLRRMVPSLALLFAIQNTSAFSTLMQGCSFIDATDH